MLRPEIINGRGRSAAERQELSRREKRKEIQRIGPGLYSGNLLLSPWAIIKRNAMNVAAAIEPGAVLASRSGFELVPAEGKSEQHIFVSGSTAGTTELETLTIHRVRGPGPLEGDNPYLGLHLPSFARRCLENLVPARVRKGGIGIPRTLGREEVERRLERLCAQEGEARLNEERDRARRISTALSLEAQFEELDSIISALLGTRKVTLLEPAARARAAGQPYDPDVIKRFALLAEHLSAAAHDYVAEPVPVGESWAAACFIESYFSNYIEGTRFPLEEAQRIVFDGYIPHKRPQDGHDVLATFRQLADMRLGELGTPPEKLDYRSFREETLSRHLDLMRVRPEVSPGKFKEERNQAGSTFFVEPDLVEGTLRAAVDIMNDTRDPLARALLTHFVLVEVHPFNDGNGRLSRIMMTKALVSCGLSRIVVPTVHRDDYVGTLRLLSKQDRADPFVRCLKRLQTVSAAAHGATVYEAVERWASANAFLEPHEALLRDVDPSAEIIRGSRDVPMRKALADALEQQRKSGRMIPILGGPDEN
jgi:hypothetical protein